MTTTVCPACNAFVTPVNGPAWYMGPHTRWVPWSTGMPKPWQSTAAAVPATSSGSPSGSGRRTPLGCPVVPDVYIITAPGCAVAAVRVASGSGRSRAGSRSISPTAKRIGFPSPWVTVIVPVSRLTLTIGGVSRLTAMAEPMLTSVTVMARGS